MLTNPPGPPTINGRLITVDMWLKNPTRVQRVMEELSRERFVADFLFAPGDAQGGAVIYDQVTEQDLYTDRDVQEIAPGAEFPLVGASDPTPKVDAVVKRGGAFLVTYENVRRNQRDVIQRGTTKLRNTMIKKVDSVAMAKITAEPLKQGGNAADEWTVAATGDPLSDFYTAKSAISQSDLGYEPDTTVIHPSDALNLLKRKDIRDALPRENTTINPVLSGKLAGLAGIENWVVTNRQTAGVVDVCQAKIIGSQRDELPLYTRVIDLPWREAWLVQAGRVSVPIITDPLAIYRISGTQ
ncbi:major capsid protein [Jiangella muralis]|uniref:major capsid protein n=1 Tax=Jiangella muralis TaxID=702383 RepID=UPI00069FF198|nr:major capsid protein [Jiangella muralis]